MNDPVWCRGEVSRSRRGAEARTTEKERRRIAGGMWHCGGWHAAEVMDGLGWESKDGRCGQGRTDGRDRRVAAAHMVIASRKARREPSAQ